MATQVGEVYLKIGAVMQGFDEALNKAASAAQNLDKKFEVLQTKLSSVGKSMTLFVTAPIIAAAGAAIKFASDYEESINKVDVAFGNSAEAVKEWSKTSLTSIGLAAGTALDAAATYGDMATAMGLTQQKAADMSVNLVNLSGDLASFKNISIDVASTALKGIFTGEGEALKGLGVIMLDSTLKSFALSQGIKTKYEAMTQAEKVNLRYNYVLSQTTNAQGDFARTGGGAANQMRMFTEGMKELGQTFGTIILPMFTSVITKINEMVAWVKSIDEENKSLIATMIGVAAAIGPVLYLVGQGIAIFNAFSAASFALKTMTLLEAAARGHSTAALVINKIAVVALTFATKALQLAMSTGPMGAMIAVAVALAGGYALLTRETKTLMSAEETLAQARKGNLEISDKNKSAMNAWEASARKAGSTTKQITAELEKHIAVQQKLYDEQQRFTYSQNSAAAQQHLLNINASNLKLKEIKAAEAAAKPQATAPIALGDKNKDAEAAQKKYIKLIEETGKTVEQLENIRYGRELKDLEESHKKGLVSTELYEKAKLALAEENAKNIAKIQSDALKKNVESTISMGQQLSGQLSEVMSMAAANEQARLDNRRTKQLESIAESYDIERQAIEAAVLTEAQKNDALQALDAKRARDEKKVNDTIDKEKRKLARESAKDAKKLAIFDATLSGTQAAMAAYAWGMPIGGPILGGIMAGIASAFAAVKIALIKAQPLPMAAKGIFANSPYIGGEAGPELAFPLSSPNGTDALRLFSQQLLGEMSKGTISTGKGSATAGGDVYLDGSLMGKWIQSGVEDRRIILT